MDQQGGQDPGAYERSIGVQLRGLAKRFGTVVAVAGVDLDVRRGCFFGLVGPKRRGKDNHAGDGHGAAAP